MRPIIEALLAKRVTGSTAIAARLNDAGHKTRKGKAWYAEAVDVLIDRLGLRQDESEVDPVAFAHVPARRVEVGWLPLHERVGRPTAAAGGRSLSRPFAFLRPGQRRRPPSWLSRAGRSLALLLGRP
jgi:hypothetical protein